MIEVRKAESDADLEAWRQVRLAVLPNESAGTVEHMRALETPERLVLLAELDGELAGSGLADRSDTGNGFVAPRVMPEKRRRGVGTALLRDLLAHVEALGFQRAGAHVEDPGSLAFARFFGFEEIDRQVEQVRVVESSEEEPEPFEGVDFVSIAQQPELLEQAYDLACEGYSDLVLVSGTVEVSLERWLRDEATLPDGSFVALADGEIVGYAGLLRWEGEPEKAEHGLTVVRRTWRGRGLAAALKRREIAWASRAGIRELVTWTQRGNENMQRVNNRLGYVNRSESLTMQKPLR
jgi:mycothiol synthase